jgi:hypothetical protein
MVAMNGRLQKPALGLALIVALGCLTVAAIPDAKGQGPIIRRAEGQSMFNNWNRLTFTVSCPAGFYVIAGGGRVVNSTVGANARNIYLRGSFPFENGWRVEGQSINASAARWALRVWAVCSNA